MSADYFITAMTSILSVRRLGRGIYAIHNGGNGNVLRESVTTAEKL